METTIAGTFGDLLRGHRLAAGLTQEALAARAGLSVRAITDLERGVRRAPYRETVRMLADALALHEAGRAGLESAARLPRERRAGLRLSPLPQLALRAPLTPLLGREREVATATRLMRRADVRLATLTGAGGVGKTRLGIEVAAGLQADFTDGLAFVPLAPLADPGLVLTSIAQVLRVTEVAGRPVAERLGEALRERHLLLVLDSFEHLLGAAPDVARLLERCPRLKVMATSRAALRLSGEHELPVPPLAVPERTEPSADLRRYASVDLFCRRAEAARRSMTITPRDLAVIGEIVRRLDGLPLAIELAAARSAVLAPAAILARLDDRFSLLTGGARDLPARQRTLRATIAWSHDLLTSAEQALFRRLAVFSGGWTIEAAEAVCRLDPTDDDDLLVVLATLVEQSLVRPDEQDGESRLVMLETVREFALERLEASGEATVTRDRHRDWVAALAEQASPFMYSGEREPWIRRFLAEQDNVRSALHWCEQRGEPEAGLCILEALWIWYWVHALAEGRAWAERLLALPGAGGRTVARARGLYAATSFAFGQGDLHAVRAYAEEQAAIARELGDTRLLTVALVGLVVTTGEDLPAARATLADARSLSRTLGHPWLSAFVAQIGGILEVQAGDPLRARALLADAEAGYRSIRDQWFLPVVQAFAGLLALREGDLDIALASLGASLATFRGHGDSKNLAVVLAGLGAIADRQGDQASAEEYFRESVSSYREVGDRAGAAVCLEALASLALARDNPEQAARLVGAAEAQREPGDASMIASCAAHYRQTADRVRAALGDEAFVAACAMGHALSLDEAIALALAGTERSENRE